MTEKDGVGRGKRARRPGLLDEYLSETELAKELGVKPRTLRKWRAQNIGPAYVKFAKRVKYHRDGVPVYLKSIEQKPGRNRRSA
jgi:transposase-like protein